MILWLFYASTLLAQEVSSSPLQPPEKQAVVNRCDDFQIDGNGVNPNWQKTGWITLPRQSNPRVAYTTRVKLLYSATGMYFLYACDDARISATMTEDFSDLWNEDVLEVFLQPDEKRPEYLEYELSPLNHELPIWVRNDGGGNLARWMPFHYEGNQRTKHLVAIDSSHTSHRQIYWTAEFFIPFTLMGPLTNPPQRGARWKANLYRIDYDQGETLFTWSRNSGDFHDYTTFGTLVFN